MLVASFCFNWQSVSWARRRCLGCRQIRVQKINGTSWSVHQVSSMMAVARSILFHWAQAEAFKIIWAPAKTYDILEQLHQDIGTYYHETLRNDRGDTKNDDFWYTCLPDFIRHIKSSGTMRDTQKTMTISATSFRGCNRFSPLLI